MKKTTIMLLLAALFSACGKSNSGSAQQDTPQKAFEQFVDSIPTLSLPYQLRSGDQLVYFDQPTSQVPEGAMLMGKLPSRENIHFIIYSYPADIRLPVLEVYDNSGTRLSETPLWKYSCPLDAGWQSKSSITEDYNIYIDQVCDGDDSQVDRDTIRLKTLLNVE